jgi:Choline/ethanolamine kinase
MERVHGVALDDLPAEVRPGAVQRAIKFIEGTMLPQLRSLKSDRNGSLHGEIIPPRRVVERYKDTEWIPHKAQAKVCHFCHNDLRQHDILCDRQTGDVISIIDWEYAGYYDQHFDDRFGGRPIVRSATTSRISILSRAVWARVSSKHDLLLPESYRMLLPLMWPI